MPGASCKCVVLSAWCLVRRHAARVRRAEEEAEAWRDERTVAAADFGPGAEREHQVQLPLNELSAGGYRLRVSAEPPGTTTFRELDFTVRH